MIQWFHKIWIFTSYYDQNANCDYKAEYFVIIIQINSYMAKANYYAGNRVINWSISIAVDLNIVINYSFLLLTKNLRRFKNSVSNRVSKYI